MSLRSRAFRQLLQRPIPRSGLWSPTLTSSECQLARALKLYPQNNSLSLQTSRLLTTILRNSSSHRVTSLSWNSSARWFSTTASASSSKSQEPSASSDSSDSTASTTASSSFSTQESKGSSTSSSSAKEEQTGEQKTSTPEPEISKGKQLFRNFIDFLLYFTLGYASLQLGQMLMEWPLPCANIVQVASKSPLIERFVGLPLSPSMLWSGNVTSHSAKVVIPVTGPKGSAKIHGRAVLRTDLKPPAWEVVTLHAQVPELEDRMTDIIPPTQFEEQEAAALKQLEAQAKVTIPPAVV